MHTNLDSENKTVAHISLQLARKLILGEGKVTKRVIYFYRKFRIEYFSPEAVNANALVLLCRYVKLFHPDMARAIHPEYSPELLNLAESKPKILELLMDVYGADVWTRGKKLGADLLNRSICRVRNGLSCPILNPGRVSHQTFYDSVQCLTILVSRGAVPRNSDMRDLRKIIIRGSHIGEICRLKHLVQARTQYSGTLFEIVAEKVLKLLDQSETEDVFMRRGRQYQIIMETNIPETIKSYLILLRPLI